MPDYDPQATAAGIDVSRRVAWARFYKARNDNRILLLHNRTLIRILARFAIRVLRSEAVLLFEPELAEEAKRTLLTLSLRAQGAKIVDEVIAEDQTANR